MVETQLCKLRDTSETRSRHACAMLLCSICNMVFANYIYDMVDIQFNKFRGRPFPRVLLIYVLLMKDIGR